MAILREMRIQEHVSLRPYTTFQLPVQARYFVEIYSEQDLQELFASPLFQTAHILIL